ncbi:unnamed protein product [Arctia plantaginis]|uniref:Uncharacterized protein n=1 Tax=Arctia plantaginis TaxID=874455 RepID=A0A8S0YX64_ARCPL|nr:unnamed protein product [Arctia plantaginis]
MHVCVQTRFISNMHRDCLVHLLYFLISWLPMNAHNEAIFDCLEDYMDELIENFEDFAKKSLVLITAALGSIVLMAMYFLRKVTSRNNPNINIRRDKCESKSCCRPKELALKCSTSKKCKKEKSSCNRRMLMCNKKTCSVQETMDDSIKSSRSSSEEKLIREVKLSACSKTFPSCDQNGTKNTESNSRVTLISANLEEMQTQTAPKDQPLTKPTFTPGCLPKHHLSKPRPCARYIAIRNSCCSMCCYDDDRR